MQIEKMTNVTMLKAMLDSVTAQINRTSEEETDLLKDLAIDRDRVLARLEELNSGE